MTRVLHFCTLQMRKSVINNKNDKDVLRYTTVCIRCEYMIHKIEKLFLEYTKGININLRIKTHYENVVSCSILQQKNSSEC